MTRGKAVVSIVLPVAEREELKSLVRSRSTGQATALRARMILMAAEGATNAVIAERLGIGSQHTVGRWRNSTDPLFVEKVRDIVGLYLNPPKRAVVLCVDEKPAPPPYQFRLARGVRFRALYRFRGEDRRVTIGL